MASENCPLGGSMTVNECVCGDLKNSFWNFKLVCGSAQRFPYLWMKKTTDREETLHDVAHSAQQHKCWNEKLASAAESLIKNSIHIISIPSSELALTRLLLVWMKHKCNFTLLSSWCGPTRGSRFLNISASHRWMQTKWSFILTVLLLLLAQIFCVYPRFSLASQNFFFAINSPDSGWNYSDCLWLVISSSRRCARQTRVVILFFFLCVVYTTSQQRDSHFFLILFSAFSALLLLLCAPAAEWISTLHQLQTLLPGICMHIYMLCWSRE